MRRFGGRLWEVVVYQGRTAEGLFGVEVPTLLLFGKEFTVRNFKVTICVVLSRHPSFYE